MSLNWLSNKQDYVRSVYEFEQKSQCFVFKIMKIPDVFKEKSAIVRA